MTNSDKRDNSDKKDNLDNFTISSTKRDNIGISSTLGTAGT